MFWETIWNHQRNRSLRDRRPNPNVLREGDVVFVPDLRRREEQCQTTRTHLFRIKGIPTRFNVRMLDADNQPIADARYTLRVDGSTFTGSTDPDGQISHIVPPNAGQAVLTVHSTDPEEEDEVYEFALRHLNPVDDPKGLRARLKNLGFWRGEIEGEVDDGVREAISRFQTVAGLEPTGNTDRGTLDALVIMHKS
ncbi:MAG: peptidoglycan-binding protein [Bryobacteraceae bacterium]